MNIIKQSLLFVSRKRSKTVLIGLVLMVLTIFVLLSIQIQQSIHHYVGKIRQSVGSSFTLVGNKNEEDSLISPQMIENILTIEGVKKINPSYEIYGRPINFSNIKSSLSQNDTNYDDGIKLIGTNDIMLQKKFSKQIFDIVDGSEIDLTKKYVAIINETLAEKNNVGIGDSIEIGNNFLQTQNKKDTLAKVRIIGIFKNIEEKQGDGELSIDKIENTIYVDLATIEELEQLSSLSFNSIEIFCKDPTEMSNIISKTEKLPAIQSSNLMISENASDYNNMAGPLLRLENMIRKLLVLIFVGGAILIVLILNLWIKERTKEAGIMLSIGKSKMRIICQFITEVMFIYLFSYLIAVCICLLLGEIVVKNYVDYVSAISVEMYVTIFAIEGIVIVGTVLIASYQLVKFKPKEILSKLS